MRICRVDRATFVGSLIQRIEGLTERPAQQPLASALAPAATSGPCCRFARQDATGSETSVASAVTAMQVSAYTKETREHQRFLPKSVQTEGVLGDRIRNVTQLLTVLGHCEWPAIR